MLLRSLVPIKPKKIQIVILSSDDSMRSDMLIIITGVCAVCDTR